jgi:hypothetical protein
MRKQQAAKAARTTPLVVESSSISGHTTPTTLTTNIPIMSTNKNIKINTTMNTGIAAAGATDGFVNGNKEEKNVAATLARARLIGLTDVADALCTLRGFIHRMNIVQCNKRALRRTSIFNFIESRLHDDMLTVPITKEAYSLIAQFANRDPKRSTLFRNTRAGFRKVDGLDCIEFASTYMAQERNIIALVRLSLCNDKLTELIIPRDAGLREVLTTLSDNCCFADKPVQYKTLRLPLWSASKPVVSFGQILCALIEVHIWDMWTHHLNATRTPPPQNVAGDTVALFCRATGGDGSALRSSVFRIAAEVTAAAILKSNDMEKLVLISRLSRPRYKCVSLVSISKINTEAFKMWFLLSTTEAGETCPAALDRISERNSDRNNWWLDIISIPMSDLVTPRHEWKGAFCKRITEYCSDVVCNQVVKEFAAVSLRTDTPSRRKRAAKKDKKKTKSSQKAKPASSASPQTNREDDIDVNVNIGIRPYEMTEKHMKGTFSFILVGQLVESLVSDILETYIIEPPDAFVDHTEQTALADCDDVSIDLQYEVTSSVGVSPYTANRLQDDERWVRIMNADVAQCTDGNVVGAVARDFGGLWDRYLDYDGTTEITSPFGIQTAKPASDGKTADPPTIPFKNTASHLTTPPRLYQRGNTKQHGSSDPVNSFLISPSSSHLAFRTDVDDVTAVPEVATDSEPTAAVEPTVSSSPDESLPEDAGEMSSSVSPTVLSSHVSLSETAPATSPASDASTDTADMKRSAELRALTLENYLLGLRFLRSESSRASLINQEAILRSVVVGLLPHNGEFFDSLPVIAEQEAPTGLLSPTPRIAVMTLGSATVSTPAPLSSVAQPHSAGGPIFHNFLHAEVMSEDGDRERESYPLRIRRGTLDSYSSGNFIPLQSYNASDSSFTSNAASNDRYGQLNALLPLKPLQRLPAHRSNVASSLSTLRLSTAKAETRPIPNITLVPVEAPLLATSAPTSSNFDGVSACERAFKAMTSPPPPANITPPLVTEAITVKDHPEDSPSHLPEPSSQEVAAAEPVATFRPLQRGSPIRRGLSMGHHPTNQTHKQLSNVHARK